MNTIRASDRVYQGCKSQASQIGPGRAVPARKFEWTRISVGPSRAFQAQNFCRPGRAGPFFLPIFREDFANIPHFFWKNNALKWANNKAQIIFKNLIMSAYYEWAKYKILFFCYIIKIKIKFTLIFVASS